MANQKARTICRKYGLDRTILENILLAQAKGFSCRQISKYMRVPFDFVKDYLAIYTKMYFSESEAIKEALEPAIQFYEK